MSWSKALDLRERSAVVVGIGSALVQFHPALERRLDADRRVDALQVGVLDVLLDLGADAR